MNARRWSFGALWMLLASVPFSEASARALSVEVATDRGHDAVYESGDPLVIETHTSDDAYLMVYEIDAEGYVHLLFPDRHTSPRVEGERTYYVPDKDSDLELVAKGPTGQGYIVAIASDQRFRDLPWYLRPYDAQAEEMGYDGEPDQDSGVTAEGRIVGDPFVAMERIRRAVLEDSQDENAFATAYTRYYIGHEVRYPRYLCYDCHRQGYWSWWSGFDPYYTTCSAFDFRVNWHWGWGPSYWTGYVPYYMFVYRTDCPPRYRVFDSRGGARFSSWNGWRQWNTLWGGPLRRFKTASPPNTAFDPSRRTKDFTPPGYLQGGGRNFRGGVGRDPVARNFGGDRSKSGDRGDVQQRSAEIRERMRLARSGVRDPRVDLGRREPRDSNADPGRPREGQVDRGRTREWRGEPPRDGGRGARDPAPPRDGGRGARDQAPPRDGGRGARDQAPPRDGGRGARDQAPPRDSGRGVRDQAPPRESRERPNRDQNRIRNSSWGYTPPGPSIVPDPQPPSFQPTPYTSLPTPRYEAPPSQAPPSQASPPPAARAPEPPRFVPDMIRSPRPEMIQRLERKRRE